MTASASAKRNFIAGATQLIRVTRGRGLIFSSEARSALSIRAPIDVMNLAAVWGLGMEKGKDALTKEPRRIVEFARLKRQSYKGVVDVVYGGEKPAIIEEGKTASAGIEGKADKTNAQKRKMEEPLEILSKKGDVVIEGEKPISKRQMKRDKKARLAAGSGAGDQDSQTAIPDPAVGRVIV